MSGPSRAAHILAIDPQRGRRHPEGPERSGGGAQRLDDGRSGGHSAARNAAKRRASPWPAPLSGVEHRRPRTSAMAMTRTGRIVAGQKLVSAESKKARPSPGLTRVTAPSFQRVEFHLVSSRFRMCPPKVSRCQV